MMADFYKSLTNTNESTDLGSGVEDQKTFLQKILLDLKSNADLVNLLNILGSKCSGIQEILLDQIKNNQSSISPAVIPKNLKLPFTNFRGNGKEIAFAKNVAYTVCQLAIPLLELLLLQRFIEHSGLVNGFVKYTASSLILSGVCITGSFKYISSFYHEDEIKGEKVSSEKNF